MVFDITRAFSRSEKGSLSVEAVLVLPILVWAITATIVFWDAFKTLNLSQKATYTVADMLSRETGPIDVNYMTATHELFDYLSSATGDNAVRVTVVSAVEDVATGLKTVELVWSEASGTISGYTDLSPILARIPEMSTGEQLIIVESEQEWSPIFSVGLANYRFREVAISRPRFAPQLVWDNSGATGGNS